MAKITKNQKINLLLRDGGIKETRMYNDHSKGWSYEKDGHVYGVVFADDRQSIANLPYTAETDDWIGYFSTSGEAILAVLQHIVAEAK